ncbi:FAD-dependent oxidoreductase [Providencia sp. JGM181]|uniref:flavin monoamine oxidase family protein n=1 Tax=unclassified Providencia TaxID=2633465 RepID=UPI001BABD70A|nr:MULTISPECIES: NAD(P)/FAD-dependent oxidoreductase [unclassified Providencia]MBS0922862.1 FAD-dependent oxidoreductase [Providencia sp. JGM181]MBS0933093.1 FAD-dependent oxidoreductase [Providencia sp. JGM172]MBS0997286.1 FAD-dependent oxidoreductase [Providencia sp. JGM178]
MPHIDADIIVIGAGVSGLSVANQLQSQPQNSQHKKVLILEARDRLGGRIHTREIDNQFYDLGASWIHGITDNPISAIAQQHHIQTVVFNYQDAIFYKKNGLVLCENEKEAFEAGLDYLMEQFETISSPCQFNNAAEALNSWLQSPEFHHLLTVDHHASQSLFEQLQTGLHEFFEVIAEDPCACTLETLSPYFLQLEGFCEGDEVIFPRGYSQIIETLSNGLDIRLNHPVEHIHYLDNYVTITTLNGQQFNAHKVVVTVPLGVLKKNKIHFTPALPEKTQEAIHQLGFGVFNKLFVTFEQAFWRKNSLNNVNSMYIHESDYWLNFMDVSAIYQKPTLLFLFGGLSAKWLEECDEYAAWHELQQSLSKVFDNVPAPIQLIKTEWEKDIYAYGSFSYPAPNYSADQIAQLKQPIDNKIFFAGEHLALLGAGTVHGAYQSGIDTANSLLNTL